LSDDEIIPATPVPEDPTLVDASPVFECVQTPAANWKTVVESSFVEFCETTPRSTLNEVAAQMHSPIPALDPEVVHACNTNPTIMSAVMTATAVSAEKVGAKEVIAQVGDLRDRTKKIKRDKLYRRINLVIEIIHDVEDLGPHKPNSPLGKIHVKLRRLYNMLQDKVAKKVTLLHLSFFSAEYRLGRQVTVLTTRIWIVHCTLHGLAAENGCFYFPGGIRMTTSGLTCKISLSENGQSKQVHVGEFLLLQTKGISKEGVAALIGVSASTLHYSHLCHLAVCCNPLHGVIEPVWRNNSRKPCSRMNKCVCKQTPPCFVPCHPSDTEQLMFDELGYDRRKRGKSTRTDFEKEQEEEEE
jgi:hypothetical protein